jgi:2-methylcitrate dehydratase PrpD
MALAHRAAAMERAPTPPAVTERARHALLDWLAVTLTGAGEDAARIVQRVIAAEGGAPRCTVVGTPSRTSAQRAALANGIAAHAIDFDDSFPAAVTHGSACIVPAAFAVAQARHASEAQLLDAIVVGFEVLSLLGPAIGEEHYARGFHSTGTLGTVAATAAAGRLHGLGSAALAQALSLGAAQAAGLKHTFGTMAKPFNAGHAAAGGVLAAELVAAGFTAPPDTIEGHQGLAATQTADWDPRRAPFDRPFGAGIEGIVYKVHACCHATQSSIEGVRELVAAGLRPAQVEHVLLEVCPAAPDMCAIPEPRTGLEGKFSLAHTTALVLSGTTTGPDGFTDEVVRRPELEALRRRVEVVARPDRGMFHSRVVVTLIDGTVRAADVDILRPVADGDLPDQWARLADKFRALADPVLGDDRARRLLETVRTAGEDASTAALADLAGAG